MGHGNGFEPLLIAAVLPERPGPQPSRHGQHDDQYCGVPLGEVRWRAVVLLPLCYASGSNPQDPADLSRHASVRQLAAGFAPAPAVVAEGHFSPAWYIRQLFTTHKTVDRIWKDSPTYNGNDFSFLSTRTPGATAQMDPDGSPNGYWRAVTGWLDTTTDEITGARYAATDSDPLEFTVLGAASVNVDAAGVYPDATLTPDSGTGLPDATLPRDTKLRLLAQGGPTPEGNPILHVATIDRGTTGWMSGADLLPRDRPSPVIWTLHDADGALSPNGDGVATRTG